MSVLRFVVEDAALHLSNRVGCGVVNLVRDYVCLLDVDLIEISLRVHSKQSSKKTCYESTPPILEDKFPSFELQTSFNVVRIRTCADSCRLLLDLITYLAEDGDFEERDITASEESVGSGSAGKADWASFTGQTFAENSLAETKVNDLMAEAMLDSNPEEPHRILSSPKTKNEQPAFGATEVFFFPDENQVSRMPILCGKARENDEPSGVWHQDVDKSLIDDALNPVRDEFPASEEEFCILENDPGIGFMVNGRDVFCKF